jgi:FMN phosphatase YigB (HAD superfamily)
MPLDPTHLRAVVFDYGNTLIEFTRPHVDRLDAAIAGAIEQAMGPVDRPRFIELRTAAYRAAYGHPELREVTMHEQLTDILTNLFGRPPQDDELAAIIQVHDRAFVEVVEAPDYVHALLEKLQHRYKLAMISNYPCGKSIRASLQRTGIAPRLSAVAVSGEVGYVKPHPLPFTTVLDELGVEPHEAVYIGDNWLGDIQGAKRLGMAAIHTTQFDTLEIFDREPDHHDADLVIGHLTELEAHLLARV